MGNAVHKLLTDRARVSPDLVPQTCFDFTQSSSPISGLGESSAPGCHGESGTRSQTQLPSQPREQTHRPHSPKNPTHARSRRSTLMNWKANRRSYPSASGNERFQGSSKVRFPGTGKMAPFVRPKSALTCHQNQNSNFSSRGVQPGRLGLETRPTGDDTTWEEVREHEPGPSTPPTSNDPLPTESQIRSISI